MKTGSWLPGTMVPRKNGWLPTFRSVMVATHSPILQINMGPEIWASPVVVLLSYLFRREQQCLGLVSLKHLSEFLTSRSSGSCLWPLGRWQSLFSPRQKESLSPSSAFLSQILSSFPSPARMLNIISSKIWDFEHKRMLFFQYFLLWALPTP